jgi:hypothetical protein
MIRRIGARRLLAMAGLVSGLLLPAVASASSPVRANLPSTLTAASMAVTVFQYHGLQTVTSAGGTFQAMEFGMATANITGFNLMTPCESRPGVGSVRYHMSSTTAAATTAVTTIQVTSLTATLSDPTPMGSLPAVVTWTVASPPALGLGILVGDAGTLTGVSATLADATSAAMTFAHLNLQAFFC